MSGDERDERETDQTPRVWQQHYRADGAWCQWSGVSHRTPDAPCPDGCPDERIVRRLHPRTP